MSLSLWHTVGYLSIRYTLLIQYPRAPDNPNFGDRPERERDTQIERVPDNPNFGDRPERERERGDFNKLR